MAEARKYRYKASLRISHPSLSPEEITSSIRLEPSRSWIIGQPRATPTGAPLSGVNKNNFWTHSFAVPDDGALEEFILCVLDEPTGRSQALRMIADTGGKNELFIGLFMETSNVELYFNPKLHSRCGQLGIALYLDIYDPDQPASGSV